MLSLFDLQLYLTLICNDEELNEKYSQRNFSWDVRPRGSKVDEQQDDCRSLFDFANDEHCPDETSHEE